MYSMHYSKLVSERKLQRLFSAGTEGVSVNVSVRYVCRDVLSLSERLYFELKGNRLFVYTCYKVYTVHVFVYFSV